MIASLLRGLARRRKPKPDPMIEVDAVLENPGHNSNLSDELAHASDTRPNAVAPKVYVKKPAKTSHDAPVMSKKPPIVGTLPASTNAAKEAMDELVAMTADEYTLPPVTHPPRNVSQAGIDLLHHFEGCARRRPDGRIEAYPDPGTGAEPWTIGWGSTRNGLHGFVNRNTVWTQRQCDERFEDDLRRVYVPEVLAALDGAPVTQGQLDALVSFAYNLGAAALRRSTLLRKHKAGDYEGAAREFLRWNRAAGRVMTGLTRRRQAEARMYRGEAWQ